MYIGGFGGNTMHKNIKYTIAASLVIGVISGTLPVNSFMLADIKAYAATYKNANNGELTSLIIKRDTGSEVKLRDSYEGDEISLTSGHEYYIKLDGSDGIEISAEVKGSGYVVKKFSSKDKTEKGKVVGDFTKVNSTYSDIYLRTYKSEDAYKEAYTNGDVTDCEETYAIHIKKPVAISDKEEDKEYAYLKNLYLSNGHIDFSKNKTSYDFSVNDNVEEILVRATPEDDDDLVEINGKSVEKDNNFEDTVKLEQGNNTIEVYVESDDDDETYTLNVYRGNKAASTSAINETSTVSSNQNNIGKFNSWQRIDGKLKYIDSTGQPLKNTWWFDKDTGKDYYLKEDGSMAMGWVFDNSSWYYCDKSGEMQTGWICLDKNWYYLDKGGAMKVGWFEAPSGEWYYFDSSGAMKTGWIKDKDGKWYYLASTGKMVKDSEVGGYKLGNDGTLVG
jgi:glucan-binding YG repeat protein